MLNTAPAAAAADLVRFEVELEFVQCLANPFYIHHLAAQGPMDDARFVAYLGYLHAYWSTPAYARFITFPHALEYLRLLQDPAFRETCKSAEFCRDMQNQQWAHWQFGRVRPFVDAKGRVLAQAGAVPSLLEAGRGER